MEFVVVGRYVIRHSSAHGPYGRRTRPPLSSHRRSRVLCPESLRATAGSSSVPAGDSSEATPWFKCYAAPKEAQSAVVVRNFFIAFVPVMKAPGNMIKFLRRRYEAQPSTQSFGQSFAFTDSASRFSAALAGAVQGQENNSAPFAAAPATTAATAAATAATAPATATTAPTPREHSTKRRD